MLKLHPAGGGRYAAPYATSLAGVYVFRVRAEGLTAGGSAWTRESTLTAGVFRKRSGNGGSDGMGGKGSLCEWLQCLLKDHSVLTESAWKHLRELGVDVKLLLECLDELCPDVPKEHLPDLKQRITHAMAHDKKRHHREAHDHGKTKATKAVAIQTVADVKFVKAVAPKLVPAAVSPKKSKQGEMNIKERRQPPFPTMFTRVDLEKEEKKVAGKQENGRKRGDGGHH
jgi:hypothetical protein